MILLIFINITLKTGPKIELQQEIPAKKENNLIEFIIEDNNHLIDIQNKTFTRQNNEYLFFLNIKDLKCKLTLKKENYTLDIPVDKASLEYNQNTCNIEYLIETDNETKTIIITWEDKNEKNN